jgi:TonB family protein
MNTDERRQLPYGLRALLALILLAAIAALGFVAWPILKEQQSEPAVPLVDNRPAYVIRAREKIQKHTEATLARLPKPAGAGSLVVQVEIGPDGALLAARVTESSGKPSLDELALRIVHESAPFEPFPPDARKTTRVMEINSEFVFK